MNGKHIVLVETPNREAQASLVLLNRVYTKMELKAYLKFRESVLDAAEARDGCLKCHYCGRNDLVREPPEGVKKPRRLATIDHVVPRSKGGQDEEDNCVVACFTCNQRKGDKLEGEWDVDTQD